MIKCEVFPSGLMEIKKLCNSVSGEIIANFSSADCFDHVATDSRDVVKGSLFVPLRGENQDGHKYISQALVNGANCFFVDNKYFNSCDNKAKIIDLCKIYSACCIKVDDNLYALHDAARAYLDFFPNLVRIGVTGSSGKTTTKEMLVSVLQQKYNVVYSKGNFNSETGLPLSVFNIRNDHEVAVFELGMNRVGEIKELASIFNPFISVITNIGSAHIGILGSLEAIAEEKKQIFSRFVDKCVGFVPAGKFSEYLQDIAIGKVSVVDKDKILGLKSVDDLGIKGFRLYYDNEIIDCPLIGTHNLENIFMVLAVSEFLEIEPAFIKAGLESVKVLFARSQIIHKSISYLLDCYNANPDSMKSVINFVLNLKIKNRKIFVLGSMLELGEFSKEFHVEICKQVSKSNVDRVYIYGDEIVDGFEQTGINDDRFYAFKTNMYDDLEANVDNYLCKDDFVLLKGSRSVSLERLEIILNKERQK